MAIRKLPDIHFDARDNWFRWDRGVPRPIPLRNEPFIDADEAIRYALHQLSCEDQSMYAVIVNARAALDWAIKKQSQK